jgi:hypothetical protein
MMKLLPALMIGLAALPVAAQTPDKNGPQASGTFVGRKWMFEATGAYAFPHKVGLSDEPGILVAVSSAGLLASRLDLYWDRRRALDSLRDDDVSVVYFHFTPGGTYKGMNYYLDQGDGCGFCYDGAVQSSVTVGNGRIRGSIRQMTAGEAVTFDLSFDVPVASSDYGAPLGEGGGDPGRAYATLHAALVKNDTTDVAPVLTNEMRVEMPRHGPAIMKDLRDNHPTESYRVVRGWSRGDRALLLVEGETLYSKVRTEALFVLEDGSWRIDEEVLQVRLD